MRFLWGLVALAMCGCGNSIVSPPPQSLVGTWHVTRFEFVSKTGMGTAEVVGRGWSATLTLSADLTGSLDVVPVGGLPWGWAGAWEVDGDLFRLAGQGADVELDGRTLRLSGFDGQYDFDGDGAADPAKFNLTLTS
jgi:hypothetical protein